MYSSCERKIYSVNVELDTFELNMMLSIILVSQLIAFAFGYHGVDVSQRFYSSSFSCLVKSGYTFTVVRVYKSSGQPDSNGPLTISDAWAGGMSHVDGYIFPCYSCGNPAKQVTTIK